MSSITTESTTTAAEPLVCHECDNTFTRLEHLQRHALMHGPNRPYRCEFCSQSFGRRDVLKRHFLACKVRLKDGLEIPALSRGHRGKKRTACDRCSSLKRACSSSQPCESCASRNEECTYPQTTPPRDSDSNRGNRGADLAHYSPSSQHGNNAPRHAAQAPMGADAVLFECGGSTWNAESSLQPELANLFSFDEGHLNSLFPLNNFAFHPEDFSPENLTMGLFSVPTAFVSEHAEPRQTIPFTFRYMARFTQFSGLVDSFECGSLSERQQLVGRDLLAPPTVVTSGFMEDDMSWSLRPFDLGWTGGISTVVDDYAMPGVFDLSAVVPSGGPDMRHCTVSIVSMLRDVTLNKSRGSKISITWSPAIEATCYWFFSGPVLGRNLELFWSCWYPNSPIIHKPTFSAAQSSPGLVAAMAVMGACLSPSYSDRAHANIWFNSLEELVFQDELLLDDTISVSDPATCGDERIRQRLEAIQAAYLVCLVQYWEGSKPNKRRIRSHRYAAMLAAARDFGLGGITRRELRIGDISDFSWTNFIMVEMLIRTGTYIFLLDAAFVIFHKSPPRLVVPEMKLSLACPDDCFQAPSVEECFILLHAWSRGHPSQASLSVFETVESLCRTSIAEDGRLESLAGLSILNMFTVITAMHCLVFQFQTSLASHTELSHLQTGLDQWMLVWTQTDRREEMELNEPRALGDMWKRTGFMRHADEFWLLAQITLGSAKYPQAGGDDAVALLDEGRSSKPAGVTYDDSDMRHVRNLVSAFQNMSFM